MVDKKEAMDNINTLLAEKRTSLAVLRTALAMFTLPLSILTVLITTSELYNPMQIIPLIIPLIILCAVLIILGSYLVFRSMRRIKRIDKKIENLKNVL